MKDLTWKVRLLLGFAGGTFFSWLQMAEKFKLHETPDVYFFLGMLVAGVIGIFGVATSRARDMGGAIASGISAPQILGGGTKLIASAPVKEGVTWLLAPLLSIATAQPLETVKVDDSVHVKAIVTGTDQALKLKSLDDKQTYLMADTIEFSIKKQDSMAILGAAFPVKLIEIPANEDSITINVKVQHEVSRKNTFFEGLFAQHYRHKKEVLRKMEVEVKKADPIK